VVDYVRPNSSKLAGFSVHDSRNRGINVELALFLEDRIRCRHSWSGQFAGLAAFDCSLHG
jgi:hypothetical protein